MTTPEEDAELRYLDQISESVDLPEKTISRMEDIRRRQKLADAETEDPS